MVWHTSIENLGLMVVLGVVGYFFSVTTRVNGRKVDSSDVVDPTLQTRTTVLGVFVAGNPGVRFFWWPFLLRSPGLLSALQARL